ncbi:MAG: acylase [Anaerolineales bacterium]|nr:acylase [Anaerolineales bacterium]
MLLRIPTKLILGVLLALILITVVIIIWPQRIDLSHLANAGDPYDARILRDTWGVPHVFGKTDADTAYGLAYANAEDDFLTIQQSLAAARGVLASIYGSDAAANDYMVQLFRIWDVVHAGYFKELAPETRVVLEAYAAGINHYAALHQNEVLSPDLFPVEGKDIVAASIHKSPLFFGLDGDLAELYKDERQREISPRLGDSTFEMDNPYGSNSFTVGPSRTSDGSTYLGVNSHQPWQGAVTWYEAHVHSEEGWDAVGGIFPGSPMILHGHNRNLGWAFTVNHPDLVDIYVLEINPDDPNQYLFDGEWLELEVRTAPIEVKFLGNFKWTFEEEVLWSVHGPVVRQDHGTYALRYAGFGIVNIFEQVYRMNKATNFEEWLDALRDDGFSSFNVNYADKDGNIYYAYNADLPIRTEGYDWSLYLPGDTSETLWTEYLPFEDLPQILNPPSGFLQNANSTPYETTVGSGNIDPEDFSPTLGIETQMTNRALRALELFSADESITFDEFVEYKYDMSYSVDSDMPKIIEMILDSPTPDDPNLREAVGMLQEWDLRASPESVGATLAILTFYDLAQTTDGIRGSGLVGSEVTPAEANASFTTVVDTLMKNFGRIDVPWKEVNRLIRGDADLGLGGGPDLLHAIYGDPQDDGRLKGFIGDSYVLLIRWDPDGEVHSYSIHQYGSAPLDEESPHYNDQSPLFAERQLKEVWFDEADIRANLEREYRAGEEVETGG